MALRVPLPKKRTLGVQAPLTEGWRGPTTTATLPTGPVESASFNGANQFTAQPDWNLDGGGEPVSLIPSRFSLQPIWDIDTGGESATVAKPTATTTAQPVKRKIKKRPRIAEPEPTPTTEESEQTLGSSIMENISTELNTSPTAPTQNELEMTKPEADDVKRRHWFQRLMIPDAEYEARQAGRGNSYLVGNRQWLLGSDLGDSLIEAARLEGQQDKQSARAKQFELRNALNQRNKLDRDFQQGLLSGNIGEDAMDYYLENVELQNEQIRSLGGVPTPPLANAFDRKILTSKDFTNIVTDLAQINGDMERIQTMKPDLLRGAAMNIYRRLNGDGASVADTERVRWIVEMMDEDDKDSLYKNLMAFHNALKQIGTVGGALPQTSSSNLHLDQLSKYAVRAFAGEDVSANASRTVTELTNLIQRAGGERNNHPDVITTLEAAKEGYLSALHNLQYFFHPSPEKVYNALNLDRDRKIDRLKQLAEVGRMSGRIDKFIGNKVELDPAKVAEYKKIKNHRNINFKPPLAGAVLGDTRPNRQNKYNTLEVR